MRISDWSSDVCSSDLEPAGSLKGRLLKVELIDRAELAQIEQHELITRGLGYLKRPTEVAPKNGDPCLSCYIGALAGRAAERRVGNECVRPCRVRWTAAH